MFKTEFPVERETIGASLLFPDRFDAFLRNDNFDEVPIDLDERTVVVIEQA